jgi:hypothetical protein
MKNDIFCDRNKFQNYYTALSGIPCLSSTPLGWGERVGAGQLNEQEVFRYGYP